jgi:hypothetical protein
MLLVLIRHSFEAVLKLLLDGDNLFVEGGVVPGVQACIVLSIGARSLPAANIDLVLLHLLILLNYGLYESWLAVQIDSMFVLQVVNVIV